MSNQDIRASVESTIAAKDAYLNNRDELRDWESLTYFERLSVTSAPPMPWVAIVNALHDDGFLKDPKPELPVGEAVADDYAALVAEARVWAEESLPPDPWCANHIALRLATALEHTLAQLEQITKEKAL